MKIDLNKKYTYRNGEPARILCVDAPGEWPVIAMCDTGEVTQHDLEGKPWRRAYEDLIEIPEAREPREVVIEYNGDGKGRIVDFSEEFPIGRTTFREVLPTPEPSQVAEEWRELGPDEVIQEGDEVTATGARWTPAYACVGFTPEAWNGEDGGLRIRRRITPSDLTLEVGKFYENRKGERVGPIIKHPRMPLFGTPEVGRSTWYLDGTMMSNKKCDGDLIREIPSDSDGKAFPEVGARLRFKIKGFNNAREESGAIVEVIKVSHDRFETTATPDHVRSWQFDANWQDGLELVTEPPEILKRSSTSIKSIGEALDAATPAQREMYLQHALEILRQIRDGEVNPEDEADSERQDPAESAAKAAVEEGCDRSDPFWQQCFLAALTGILANPNTGCEEWEGTVAEAVTTAASKYADESIQRQSDLAGK